ncbi:zf-HC2 domain-containing protein [Thermogemmata fonticola]|uniref:Zinc-finger domain-containing protein n=1 Tax=Thermogemmata fonticola TaxID=2755323 RepID=A0A7V9AB13_9BACT|nr:hypothetical protein [Thermogemmata fonticola]MBA2225573.1 hypothetical protein [Thermogemmata fonticola]
MMTCERCEQLLLDYLYGLVESTEAEALEAHLRACASCAAARGRMEHLQKLLAAAARDRFPHVRFDPPRFQECPVPRPVSLRRAPSRPSHPARWLAWAVAAAIWLTGPLLLLTWSHHRRQLQTAQANWQESRQSLMDIEGQLRQYQQQREQQLAEARRRVASAEQLALGLLDRWLAESRKLQQAAPGPIEIHGPPRLQAGVPNHLLLVWRDTRLSAGGRLLAEIRDQNDAVLFSQPLDPERSGERQLLRIPARLWRQVTPQSELFLVLVREDERTRHRSPIQEKIRLQGPLYITFLTTDRTRYRPGETLYFRSLTLDRVHFQPPPREQFLVYALKDQHGRIVSGLTQSGTTSLVRAENGGQVVPVSGPDGQPLRGVGCGAFVLPLDLPEGEYVLEVSEQKHPAGYGPQAVLPARCTVRIERGPMEQLAKRLDFLAPTFRPGTWVEAQALAHFRGQPAAKWKVEADATVDGHSVSVELTPHGHTDEQGLVRLRFPLPPEERLPRGDVRLQVIFHTPQGPERIARAVPVAGKQVVVEFFPEGGHLVAGVPSRVYFRATTPAGLPVDISGFITDGQKTLAHVKTLRDADQPGVNRGLGQFTFTPELGRHYWLHLTEPSHLSAPLLPESWRRQASPASVALVGVAGTLSASRGFLLPAPQPSGVVMQVPQPVTQVGEPIRVRLYAVGKPQRRIVVGAYVRGALLETRTVTLANGRWEEVDLLSDPRITLGGVVRLTVYEDLSQSGADADLLPIAERLVFRHGGQRLQIQADMRKLPVKGATATSPSAAALHLSTYDEKGRPTPAILYAAVVNSADAPGPQQRLLTTHFLVAGEIQSPDGLEYADFLLSQHPKAPEVLDLVLGTQGWRRFREWPAPKTALAAPLAPAAPAAAMPPISDKIERPWYGSSPALITRLGPTPEEARERLIEQYWPRYEQAMHQWEQARQHLAELESDPRQQAILQQFHLRVLSQQAATEQASYQQEAAMQIWQAWQQARPTMLALGIFFTLLCLVAAVRRWGDPLPWGVSTAGLLFSVLAMWFLLDGDRTLQGAARPHGDPHAATSAQQVGENRLPKSAESALSTQGGQSMFRLKELGQFPHPANIPNPAAALPSVASTLPEFSNRTPGSLQNKMELPRIDAGSPARSGILGPDKDRTAMELAGLPPPKQGSFGKAPAARIPLDWAQERNEEARRRQNVGSTGGEPNLPYSVRPPRFPGQPPPSPAASTNVQAGPVSPGGSGIGAALPDRGGPAEREMTDRARKVQEQIQELSRSLAQAEALAQRLNYNRAELLQRAWELKQTKEGPEALRSEHDSVPSRLKLETVRTPSAKTRQSSEPDNKQDEANQRQNWQVLELLPPAAPPLVVREYAPALPLPDSHQSGDTLLWMPVIIVPESGQVQLPHVLGTAQGGYDLIVAGHTQDGRLGAIRTPLSQISPQPSR